MTPVVSADAEVGSELGVEASAVGARVRHAVMHLLAALPEPVTTAKGLQRALGLDYNVCWHLMGIVKESDPMEVLRLVPGEASTRKVVAAAAGLGIEAGVVEGLDAAVAEFNRVVKAHAGDHITFKSMMASMGNEEAAEALMLKHRRTVFRAETQIRGSSVKKFLMQNFVGPKELNGHPTYVSTQLKCGFQRLRAQVKPVIFGQKTIGTDSTEVDSHALDEESAKIYGAPLLPQFCTSPLPRIGKVKGDDGWTYFVLESEKLGLTAAADVASATVTRGESLGGPLEGYGMVYATMKKCVTPVEELILEVIVHRPSQGGSVPRLAMMPVEGVDIRKEILNPSPQIQTFEKVEALGRVDRVPAVSGIKRYGAMTRYVIEKMGWAVEEFDVYRVTVQCPSMHVNAVMWMPLK